MKFPSPSSAESVVAITDLSRHFGAKTALDNVSLYVPKGGVFGLVGENGAGKTTLIKHILGLLRAEAGTVRVFDRDPVTDPVGVLGHIGYLSEQPDLPGWMRVEELLRYTKAFYPQWDEAYAQNLLRQFGLNPAQRLSTLSKGQMAKAGLLAAQAHRPDLLLLDEPSSGLDPLVRRDILEAVIRTVADEGRTVFFSSHLLEEIERVSDHIAMLHQGKLVLFGSLDEIKAQHRRFTLHFENAQETAPVIAGALNVSGKGKEWSVMCNGARQALPALAAKLGARIVDEQAASLNEIFVAHAGAVNPTQP
ncbi:ABC transporter ATP-binding protein [Pedosphaera parvula]|uniref:ABC transporter related-protein n=1 Tax=Pedosphaera parvula (strain Ellin514) TaxID=320771 RepID=B9XPJ6_PEDPL|nr:ABC transporter ATP-binding protein [Pedosphaera parvula]EEF58224.1 ABC transporter related-protein [Pedosphaera parvula Ellin514]